MFCDIFEDCNTMNFEHTLTIHYVSKKEKWTYFYWKHAGINTKIYILRIHVAKLNIIF